jgi:hypothetical protein
MSDNGSDGVKINLVSKQKLDAMSLQEKIRFILDEVQQDVILVLEEGLDPNEEAKLIESTMVEIDPDDFQGIEMESQRNPDEGGSIIGKLFRRTPYGGRAAMTVVGPADKLRTVYKDGDSIEAMVLSEAEATGQAGTPAV